MNDYFDEVGRQLGDLCQQRARRRARWPRLFGPIPGSALALVASSLVVIVVAALALGVLHSGSAGSSGGPSPGTSFDRLPITQRRAVLNDVRAVFQPVYKQHPACDALRGRSTRAAGLATPTRSLRTACLTRVPHTQATSTDGTCDALRWRWAPSTT
jgi:hypothetical protein